jgi:CRISPR system Cascade subunit CasB
MTVDQTDEADRLASLVGKIAWALSGRGVLAMGEVASLRRMDPRRPEPAFFKLAGILLDEHLPPGGEAREEKETRWAAIVVGLAHLGLLHRPGQRLGSALADAGYSESRFVRIARADADRLTDELPTLARFLAAKNTAVDWTGAAELVLSAGRRDEERVRRRLARDYYGTVARADTIGS